MPNRSSSGWCRCRLPLPCTRLAPLGKALIGIRLKVCYTRKDRTYMTFLWRQVLSGCAPLALVAVAVPAVAQTPSLGDIAKKEQERRKGSKQPAKVYTNEDL